MDKLKSRKLWLTIVAVLTSLTAFINAILNNDAHGAIEALYGLLIANGGYLLVEGAVDAIAKHHEGRKKTETGRIEMLAKFDDESEDREVVPAS